MLQADDRQTNDASGFTCPHCGGALWARRDVSSVTYECRIGDGSSASDVWIKHSLARHQARLTAARVLTENAALAWRVASSAGDRGDTAMAVRLEQEAQEEGRLFAQVRAMLEGLPRPAEDGVGRD